MLAVVSLSLFILGIIIFPFSKHLKVSKAILLIYLFITLGVFISQSLVVIDAGEVGVQIFFGKVLKRPLYSGVNFKIPLVKVVKYPTRLREYTMSSYVSEGAKKGDDSIKVRTFDGLEVGIDATVWWKIDEKKAHDIYRDTAQNTEDLEKKVVRPAIRTSLRDVISAITLNDLYSKERKKIGSYVKDNLNRMLLEKGLIIDQVLIRNIKLPANVESAIENKLKKEQDAEAMDAQMAIAKKQAKIKEIEAKGLARAQEIINRTLTANYLQHEAIEAYKDLANSDNTAFVIMPTNPKAAGMPLILNAPQPVSKKKTK